MNQTTKRIGVDVDSTLYPMDSITLPYIERRFGIKATYNQINSWSWYTRGSGLTGNDFAEIMHYCHAPEQILQAQPYPGAAEALRTWARAGHTIHVVSHRNPSTSEATLAWLRKLQVPVSGYAFAMDIDKLGYAQEHGLVGFIDDRPDFLIELVENGLGAATLRHPYNETVIDQDERIVAAKSWRQLAPKITRAFGL